METRLYNYHLHQNLRMCRKEQHTLPLTGSGGSGRLVATCHVCLENRSPHFNLCFRFEPSSSEKRGPGAEAGRRGQRAGCHALHPLAAWGQGAPGIWPRGGRRAQAQAGADEGRAPAGVRRRARLPQDRRAGGCSVLAALSPGSEWDQGSLSGSSLSPRLSSSHAWSLLPPKSYLGNVRELDFSAPKKSFRVRMTWKAFDEKQFLGATPGDSVSSGFGGSWDPSL